MGRIKLVAANWKMNLTIREGVGLIEEILGGLPSSMDCEVMVAPPFTHLSTVGDLLKGTKVQLGAQNCHPAVSGAFTGEISTGMLQDVGVTHVITGHSERRQMFGDTDDVVRAKVDAILHAGMTPVFCCGEELSVREKGEHKDFVTKQLESGILHLAHEAIVKCVIAYEPIWAIGTGVTASADQAEDMHAHIRLILENDYGFEVADSIRILYGGSVKGDNAASLFSQPNVDGALVGGASLQARGFGEIIQAACG